MGKVDGCNWQITTEQAQTPPDHIWPDEVPDVIGRSLKPPGPPCSLKQQATAATTHDLSWKGEQILEPLLAKASFRLVLLFYLLGITTPCE